MRVSTSAVRSGSSGPERYDVFLRFRGGNTRLNFTDHLYSALMQRGITTFRDDEGLERGGPIHDMLFKAIEKSSCTDSNGLRLTVLPVFYDVDPSDVRKQTGTLEAAFAEHDTAYGKDSAMVLKWKKALRNVANLTGWDLRDNNSSCGMHGKLLKEIMSTDAWKSMLNRLRTTSMKTFTDVLKVSFDGLHCREKEMFLDIACFFNGEDEDRIIKILNACEFNPQICARILRDKCLIKKKKGKFRMHDLLQRMGKEIVREESPKELGRRSRLWSFKDTRYVLENKEGSGLVEGVYLPKAFKKAAKEAESIEVAPQVLEWKHFQRP